MERHSRIAILTLVLFIASSTTTHASVSNHESDDVRTIVDRALGDARSRSSLLDARAGQSSSGRLYLATNNNAFSLSPSGEMQFRYRATLEADDDNLGFQMHRFRLHFRGHAITPALRYRAHVRYRPNSGDFTFDDLYAQYTFSSGISLRAGQFKLPFDRENYFTSGTLTLLPDRSLLNSVFSLARSTGVGLFYDSERWRLAMSLSNGRRVTNRAYNDPRVADIALSARAETRLAEAPWSQFDDQTAFRGDSFGALLGLGIHWEQGDDVRSAPGASGNTDLFAYTLDLGIEGDAWNLLAAASGQFIDSNNPTFHDLGILLQSGCFISDHLELVARYAHIFPDSDRPSDDDPFASFSIGCNYYFFPRSHALKFSAEITWYPDTQSHSSSLISAPNTSLGILPDSSSGQFALMLQLQLLF